MKTKTLKSRKILLLLSVLCLVISAVGVMSFTASADTVTVPGRTFASNDLYKLNKEITPNGSITFEAEIYIPEAYRNSRGVLLSTYNGGTYKGGFAFEVGSSAAGCEGKIRVFSQTYGNVVVNHKVTDYMGTDDNPTPVKIAVTVDTSSTSNNVVLYVNGEKKATATNSSVTSTMYNSTQTISGVTQTNTVSIGNDERLSLPFKGTMTSVAMYKGVRTAEQIAADNASEFYDTTDANLLFALDGTASHERFIEDKSANNNHAINQNYKADAGKIFSANELYKMQRNIKPNGSITFEAEIYVPEAQRSQRTGAIISNYDGGIYTEAWAFEIMAGGHVRVFSQSHGDINYINHSVTQYMGTDANPKYAKIAVTVNTSTGDAVLYVNGIKRATGKNTSSTLTANMYNTTSQLWVGGDGRPGNAQSFKGNIRSVAMYKGIRTEAEIALDNARAFYDTTDPNLLFAHDATVVSNGMIEDKSPNKNHLLTSSAGRAFSSADEPLYSAKDYTEAPLTYEAMIYAPKDIDRTGVIWGNYPNATQNCVNFEIYSGGKPSIYIIENGELKTNYKFNYDVRKNAWVHLVITQQTVNNKDTVFKCYVDGVLVDTYTQTDYVYELDMKEIQYTGPISIGRDVRAAQVYKGRIMNVALHDKPLTAEEVKNSYDNGVMANSSSLIACYDMSGECATSKTIKDVSGNGYDMQHLFYEKDFTTEDYDYSFAVVGDTQFMVYQDAVNGTNYTEYIYDWIVDNYDAKNMKYVFGLGDIIDNGKWADGSSSASAEWAYAKNLIVSTLGANNIPYSVIGGNHDFMRPWDTGFNSTFGNETTFTDNITGYYQGTEVYNYYINFEVMGTPYMLLALEYGANDDVLAWANDIVAANKHRRVIVTTHGYMYSDGTTLDGGDYAAPKPNGTDNEHYLKYNNGDEIWEEFVRKHENIAIVLSGHIDYNNIVMREDIGDHGNTVHQFLIDPQKMDRAYGFETGMVAMFYFRNGGKDVSVEYVSTYKTAMNNDKEVLFNGRNQFDFTIEEVKYQPTDKGEINVWLIGGQSNAVGYANGLTAEQLADPRYTNGFDNILYYGYAEKWQSSFAPVKLGYGNTASASGAELGIAAALGNTGEMNAIIKYAQGATALYPVTDSWAAKNFGTWTSPSYIAAKNVSTNGNQVGNLYVNFINTVESAITELRNMGYTPVIKGMWWMQGEEETYNGGADSYAELLTYLVSDIRSDLGEITETDMSKMPFIIGQIYTEKRADLQEGINAVQAEQSAYVSSDPYSALVSPKNCPEYDTQDQWHFNAATQSYLGRSFVEQSNLINGEYIVEMIGNNVSVIGGGLYKNGEAVTVTFNVKDTYELKSLTVKVGAGATESILDKLDEMSYSFVCNGENVTFTASALSAYDITTEYGIIPKEYENSAVVLFTASKSFIGAYDNVTEAAKKAIDNPNGNYVILMRKDVSQTTGTFISNLKGNILLDLGGHTLTKAGTAYIFECYYGGGAFEGGTLTVKNGTLVNCEWSSFFCYNYGASLSGNVTFGFEFENVKFRSDFTKQTGKNVIFETWDNGGATEAAIYADVVFNECIFDYTGNAEGEIMLGLTCGAKRAIFNITINGGQIIADRTIGNAEIANKDSDDAVKFGKGVNGYTVCVLVGETAITTEQFVSVDDKSLSYSEGTYTVDGYAYTLGEDVVTEYGIIPYRYTDANTYPFIVFRYGSFVYAATYFGRDNDPSALSNGKVNGTVILMRRDFVYKESQYNNLSQTHTITIDLGGYTFTSTDRVVFSAQKKTTNNTNITIKNGTFVLGNNPLIKLSSWDPATGGWTPYPGGNGFDLTFENINITLIEGATTNNVLTTNAFKAGDPNEFCNITLNNCTLDLIGSANDNVTLFDFTSNLCNAKAMINGGTIKTKGLTFVNLNGAHAESSFSFGKYSNVYTSFVLANNVVFGDLNKSYVTTDGVECVFVKVSENGENANYTLYPAVMVGYKIKTSVTLWSNFVYNIYIPVTNFNSVKVNGLAVDYEEVEIDGVLYYHIAVNLPAGEALSDFKLTVTLNTGDTTVDANWTLDVFKYTKAVLAGNYDDTTKSLMKDMLVYASAAHTYFENTASVSDKLAEIATLLNGYSAALPTGEAKKPASSTYFTDVAVNVGEVPSFRFYLAEGYTADNFTFKVGKRNAVATVGNDENGDYLEITMYAYMMLDDVTYTVVGTDVSESYNLYSYYAYATSTGNENLVAIVEALMKYSVSAKEYRDSVVNK